MLGVKSQEVSGELFVWAMPGGHGGGCSVVHHTDMAEGVRPPWQRKSVRRHWSGRTGWRVRRATARVCAQS